MWGDSLEKLSVLSYAMQLVNELAVQWCRPCPECGKPRKCRWRKQEPMNVGLLMGTLRLGKPYLSCGTPGCPGVALILVISPLTRRSRNQTICGSAASFSG